MLSLVSPASRAIAAPTDCRFLAGPSPFPPDIFVQVPHRKTLRKEGKGVRNKARPSLARDSRASKARGTRLAEHNPRAPLRTSGWASLPATALPVCRLLPPVGVARRRARLEISSNWRTSFGKFYLCKVSLFSFELVNGADADLPCTVIGANSKTSEAKGNDEGRGSKYGWTSGWGEGNTVATSTSFEPRSRECTCGCVKTPQ